jgi:ubiquinone/menaquinone biosynthesis C-methylase UbiE
VFPLRNKSDLNKERNRYNARASEKIANANATNQFEDFVINELDPINLPTLEYRKLITELIPRGTRVLELGGTGENTQPLIDLNCELYLLDISEKSLDFVKARWGSKVKCVIGNIEDLPFPDLFFDFVVGAGVLSYGKAKKVDTEISRVLKEKGSVILLDSLNHNPIYILNRIRHYVFRQRSLSTIVRIPRKKRIRDFESQYDDTRLFFRKVPLGF